MPTDLPLDEAHADNDPGHTQHHNDLAHYVNAGGNRDQANGYAGLDGSAKIAVAQLPTHATTHQPGGTDPMAVDAAAGVGSLRTLGAGATQAAPGTDARFTLAYPMRQTYVLSSPPTAAAGVADAASAISGSVVTGAAEPGGFTFLGGPNARGINYPNYMGFLLGRYPQITSSAPSTADFWLDTADGTGRFEIYWKGTGASCRVAKRQPDGSWGYASPGATFTHPANGSLYRDLVTLGAAGRYRIRLEFTIDAIFFGVQAAATDSVYAAPRPPLRYIVVGDSFSEPAIVDSGTSHAQDGWPCQLAYFTGLDVWCAGSGGTGYLQTNPGFGRPKFRDRLAADVLAYNPDGVIWAGGVNDFSGFSASAIGAEALLCFQQVLAANPSVDQIVLAPFYPAAITTASVTNLLATRDVIRSAAASVGARFLDLLSLPTQDYLGAWSSTLQAQATAGATSISVASIPAYFATANAGLDGWYVYIGTTSASENRAVTNITGSGPYTLTLGSALASTHNSGEAVTLAGRSYMTGTGRQGATTGSGNADRYTGSDGTHPTRAGHLHIAETVATLWASAA